MGLILFMLFGKSLSSGSKLCYEKLKTMCNYSHYAYNNTYQHTYADTNFILFYNEYCASAAMMVKTCANLCMQMHLQYFEHLSIFFSPSSCQMLPENVDINVVVRPILESNLVIHMVNFNN